MSEQEPSAPAHHDLADGRAAERAERRPRVLILGGCDVDLRIDLMRRLSEEYDVLAAGSERPLRERFTDAGFEYHWFPLSRGSNPLADLNSLRRLYALLSRLRPDIVHAFATKPCVWGRIAARWAGVPIVIGTIPGLGGLYAEDGLRARAIRAVYEPLQRWACRLSDLTIFQNHDDAQDCVGMGLVTADAARIIYGSGVRTDVYSREAVGPERPEAVRAEIGAGPDAVVVTMITRVIRSKGVLEFAEAARRVRELHPRAEFVLVGPDDRDAFDRLEPEEWDVLRESVRWLGRREDVPAILAASDAFAFPSYYREGLPRVLLEAASMGLPLVTTRVPGCVDAVEHARSGFLVEPRDALDLARAILRLIEDPELRRRMGQQARDLAVRRFDLEVVARETSELYRAQLEERSRDRAGGGPVSASPAAS